MNRGVVFLLIVFMGLGLFLYHNYMESSVDGFAEDVQGYQTRSLLPEDN